MKKNNILIVLVCLVSSVEISARGGGGHGGGGHGHGGGGYNRGYHSGGFGRGYGYGPGIVMYNNYPNDE
jgi:hypothetical protein